jgi:hypothetical protein
MKFKTSLFSLLVIISCIACNTEEKKRADKWTKIEKSVPQWEKYKVHPEVEAVFPQRPVSKTIGYDANITFYENFTVKDSVTYSVNIIENKSLKDAEAWKKFLNTEVLAFKSVERKNVKLFGKEAVLSKVRENNLCGYSLNTIVNESYIMNVSIRKVGDFPTEQLVMEYAGKVKIK